MILSLFQNATEIIKHKSLLMNPNGEIKLKTALFRERALKHVGDFYCLSCLYLFRTKNTQIS